MRYAETALVFGEPGARLVGVLTTPEAPSPSGDLGVVVVVGGPQYRVGSHRQFVLLARDLAVAGFPVLRFDYRGMGDAEGEPATFEDTAPDIQRALAQLLRQCPQVRRVVLWGLCDGASAALLYLQRGGDERIVGVCLLNPWVRTVTGLARAQVKHYYGQRLFEREFWRKLVSGQADIGAMVRELAHKLTTIIAGRFGGGKNSDETYPARMAQGLKKGGGQVLLVLSGRDLVAQEFIDHTAADPQWRAALAAPGVQRVDFPLADHTCSSAEWRGWVAQATVRWLGQFS